MEHQCGRPLGTNFPMCKRVVLNGEVGDAGQDSCDLRGWTHLPESLLNRNFRKRQGSFEDTFENVENFISVLSFPTGRNHSEAVVERKWTLESCQDSNPGCTLFYVTLSMFTNLSLNFISIL